MPSIFLCDIEAFLAPLSIVVLDPALLLAAAHAQVVSDFMGLTMATRVGHIDAAGAALHVGP